MFNCISMGTNIALYADDTKIWRRTECDQDHIILQNDINALLKWSKDNKMVFHPNKCKVLVVTNKYLQYVLPFDRFPYCLDGTYIDYVSSEKDLGVLITSKLNWGVHSDALVTKASSRLGLLRRTCHFTKSSDRMILIQSIFEHCYVVWHPRTTSHPERLDAIQQRAVK